MKDLHYFLLLFLFPVSLFALNTEKDDYNIFLTIEGLQYDSVVVGFVSVANSDIEIYDTTRIINGVLKYYFEPDEMYEGFIIPFSLFYKFKNGKKVPLPASRIRFYISNGENITIRAEIKDEVVSFSTQGNELSRQQAESLREKREIFKDRLNFETEYNLKAETNWTEAEQKSYWEKRKSNDLAYENKSIEFINDHLDYEYSARLLLEIRDKQKVLSLYEALAENVKQSYFGFVVGKMIQGWSSTTPGMVFPALNTKSITGEEFDLYEYRGKYVLLDFWGSWCAPCIAEIPELKQLESRYSDKLVIIGVICNDNKEKVRKAIETHNIDWVQLFSDENEFPTRYGVTAFPTKVLLDEKGVVLKVYVGASPIMFAGIEEILK